MQRDPGTSIWADCEESFPWKLDKRSPSNYLEEARRNREHGVVSIYLILEPDGTVHDPQVVHSVSPSLDRAALDAVSRCRFTPTSCVGATGKSYTFVDVTYMVVF